jgi:hypothetical protein
LSVTKNQRCPIARRQTQQLAFCFRQSELLRSANNFFQLTNLLSLLVNEQLRVTDDVDEQDVPNLELEIRLRMSGNIPLRADYTSYTFD